MEHAIGSVVTLPDGRKAGVVEDVKHICRGCIFEGEDCAFSCSEYTRSDHKSIIYKEVKED